MVRTLNYDHIINRIKNLLENNYRLNRVTVSDDTSKFVKELSLKIKSAELLSIPSGTECLTWVVPQKWIVREAYIETLYGKRIADFEWNCLYLKSYSAPFKGKISHQELISHILYDESRPDSIIYDYRSQYQFGKKTEWGFSLPYNTVKILNEKEYFVHIDTEFESGTMDVLDWILPGITQDTIFFAAHTCHPGQVNDGIACIAVIMEIFEWLQQKDNRRYTYRAIFGPEYFAAAAFLEHAQQIENLKYGFYLDMLGNGKKLGFATSFQANTYIDTITKNVFIHHVQDYVEREYRGLWGNDEMFYDGPDFYIPTVCIGRDSFENYHTDKDNFENCNFDQLLESIDILKKIINIFEADCIPVRLYKGPLYLSRYGLYIDPKKNDKGYKNLQNIQTLMNGENSCMDIASILDIDYEFIKYFVDTLHYNELVTFKNQ